MHTFKRFYAIFACILIIALLVSCAAPKSDTTATSNEISQTQAVVETTETTSAMSEQDTQNSQGPQVTDPGKLPISSLPVTLTCMMTGGYAAYDYSKENNTCLQWMLASTGIDLDITYVPGTDIETKRQLALSSGDYPDIFWGSGFTAADCVKYGSDEKIFIPLNSLIDNYSYWYKDALDVMPDQLKVITQMDGNIYGIPNTEDSYHVSMSRKMWVNKDWMEALDIKIPETTSEFYDLLIAFKTRDPNGNGITDEIPLIAGVGSKGVWQGDPCGFLLNSFCPFYSEDYSNYLYNDNGTIKCVAIMDEYREGLGYINKLWNEGLLDHSSFTNGSDDLYAITNNETKIIGCFPTGYVGCVTDVSNYENERPYHMVIPPLEGPNGRRAAWYSPQGVYTGSNFSITDKCEFPEIAFRFLDFQFSIETTMRNFWGPKGETWEWLPEDTTLKTVDGSKAIISYLPDYDYVISGIYNNRLGIRPAFMGKAYNYGWTSNEKAPEDWTFMNEVDYAQGYFTDPYVPYADKDSPLSPIIYTQEDNETLTQLQLVLRNYLDTQRVAFISGESSLDNDWATYVERVKGMELDKIIGIVQAGYDRMYK